MLRAIRSWVDWRIYWLFYRAVNRIVHENPGMAYLLELRLKQHRTTAGMPDSLRRATEVFHEHVIRDGVKA